MDNKLKKEFEEYCKLNEIEEVDFFISKCTKDGLLLDKYGVAPFLPKSQIQEVPVEKEVVKEVIKEVIIEKEVIVEKIVSKEVDNTELLEELERIRKESELKDIKITEQKEELDKQEEILEHFKNVTVNRRAQYMKTSNLNDTYLD